jgi:hypothetical protein
MSPFLRVWARWLIPFLLAGLAVGVVAANQAYVEAAPARSDFVARWEGGRAWVRDRLSPYDLEVSRRAQERVYGRAANTARGEDPQHFLYPFPSLIVFAPLGLLTFETAQAVWMSLIELALFASVLLWVACISWKWSAGMAAVTLGFSVLWFPAFAALVQAQFAAVEALLLAASLLAIRRGRDAAGGMLLAACLFKPQLGIGLVLYVVVWAVAVRRLSLLGWFVTGVVALVGVGSILEPDWLGGMARQVIDYAALPISLSPLARFSEVLGFGAVATLALSGVFVLYLVWEWRDSLRGDERRFLWTVAMTQAVLLLVAPFGIAANLVTLMLPLVVVLEACNARQGRTMGWPAAILLMLVGAFTWAVSFGTLDTAQPSLWLTLGVPLIVIVGLFWVRWWTTRARTWADLEGRVR